MTYVSNASSALRAMRRFSTAMQWLLLAGIGLAAISLLWWASTLPDMGGKDFLNALGTGLLVSAAFGVAQAAATNRVTTEILRESVVSEVSTALSRVNESFFPTHEFAGSNTPDPSFNTLVMHDLASSSIYWFCGASARYTAARLALNRSASLQVRLILPDPLVKASLDGRADYYHRHGFDPGLSVDQTRDKLRHDLLVGLAGLFANRNRCAGIELILTPTPTLDRYEVFRDSIWITLFSDKDPGTRFPRTVRFRNTSVAYTMSEAECIQARLHPLSRIIDVPRSVGDDKLLSFMEAVVGADTLTPETLQRITREFRDFRDAFHKTTALRG